MRPVVLMRLQYLHWALVHFVLRAGLDLVKVFVVAPSLMFVVFVVLIGGLARTNRSLMFFALLFPFMSFSCIRGLVELDFSNMSQLLLTILLHFLKLGLNVVMRKVEELVSVWLFGCVCGVNRSSYIKEHAKNKNYPLNKNHFPLKDIYHLLKKNAIYFLEYHSILCSCHIS